MKINDSQLQLNVVEGGAKPDFFINPVGHVIGHLTQGFVASSYPNGQSNAITAAAHVPVTLAPGDPPIDQFDFGFVQFGKVNMHGTFYAGRANREGSIAVLTHVPPALASPILYDAVGAPPDPWFETPSKSFFGGKVNASWGDHPSIKTPLRLANSGRSNIENFLFQLIFDREFWTIFTSVDPAGKRTYIAHFHWQVRYDVEFRWAAGAPMIRRDKSFVKVIDRLVKGAPTDPDLQGLVANPSGDRANKVYGQAITQSFFGARGPNRTERDTHFSTVPPDFWT